MDLKILLEFKNKGINAYEFKNPIEIIECNQFDQVLEKLEILESYVRIGKILAGFISFEFGYYFFPKLNFQKKSKFPLFVFGVYDEFVEENRKEKKNSSFQILNFVSEIDFETYKKSILNIKSNIENGETYEVNFTYKNFFNFYGDAKSFYEELKKNQRTDYSSYIEYEDYKILSLSPELFFEIENGKMKTKPMKGTTKNNEILNEKLISENHIIVDLLRNDLGKISKLGSVKLNSILKKEEFKTLNQFTSEIESELKENLSFLEIMSAIFPGGSITGAPKQKTLEIILNEENSEREIYTGAIGFYSKNFSKFSLAIRTIQIENEKAKMGIGSGIVYDSNPEEEFEECSLKTKFLLKSTDFEIFETILFKRNTFYFLKEHLIRFKNSSEILGFEFNENDFYSKLQNLNLKSNSRVRISLNRKNELNFQSSQVDKKIRTGKIKLAEVKLNSRNLFQYHKTSIRKIYNQYRNKANEKNFTDYIFLNEKEEITEGTIYNLFIKLNGEFYTPNIHSGILNGIYRQKLIDRKILLEKKLFLEDLKSAEKIYLCNSVRGIIRVELV